MKKRIVIALSVVLLLLVAFSLVRVKTSQRYPPRDLRVVLGYKDTRPARFVGDVYESAYVAMELQQMGFKRDSKDDTLFYWPQKFWEPQRPWTVRLVHSAAGPDDEDNRTNPWQKWLSQKSREEFVEGLKKADAVFYVGHSRMGGGPDFGPPRLKKNKHVDYVHYKKSKPGLEVLRLGLQRPRSGKLKYLGLYSCSSGPHFEKILKKRAPAVELKTTSEAIYYVDSLRLLMAGIKNQLQP